MSGVRELRFAKCLRHIVVCAVASGAACLGSVNVTLTPSVSSGAPVGTTITWTAHASDTSNSKAAFTYQFSLGASGAGLQVRRAFYNFNSYPWTPATSEGTFDVKVAVRSSTGATGSATEVFTVASRVTGSAPVVSRTNHPLVALYSMPACQSGRTARVRFKLPSDTLWQATSAKTCNGNTSLNFYVAGMRASTAYQLQHDVFNGPFNSPGPILDFTTGALPSGLPIPSYSVIKAPSAPNNTAYPVLLLSPSNTIPYATDSAGKIIWYLPPPPSGVNYLERPLPGGTFLMITPDGSSGGNYRMWREYDMAGNLIRETNYSILSQQLRARGADPITAMTHDSIRLPSGDTAIIATVEKVANQGSGPVDVLGDEVVVINSNLQVNWSWSEFDHLDVSRPAILHERCARGANGCPPITNPNYSFANDWTHSNALALAPDGNMVISSRHQDWIFKFRYQNGRGDGALLWKLGKDGDFQVKSSNPYPWFSHQHNVEFEPNGNLSLFDNGNTRVAELGSGNSRGQAWHLDEANKIATPVLNLDLGDYSTATGTTQLLSNGNYAFDLGYVGNTTKMKEFTPSGTLEAEQDVSHNSYRSFRMRSLYSEY